MTRSHRFGLSFVLGAWLAPALALGQDAATDAATEAAAWDALVLSYGGDSTEADAASARDAVAATLTAEGFTVLPEAEITARISPARLSGASSIEALRAIGDELGTSSVVTVAVWTSDGAPASVAVSIASGGRSFSGTAEVEGDLGAAAAAAVRAALERQSRALLVEGGTTSGGASAGGSSGSGAGEGGETDPWTEEERRAAEEEEGPEDLFGIIGPGFLLALGGAGLGLGIYAVLDTTCELRHPMTTECLRGEEPNVALGTLFIIGGAIATAGAIIWWVTDAALGGEPRIDVVDLDLVPLLDGGVIGTAEGRF